MSTAQLIDAVDVVVIGTPRAGEEMKRGRFTEMAHPVEVERVYKGSAHGRTLMWGPVDDMCGTPLTSDGALVLMASRLDGELVASTCHGLEPASTAFVRRVERISGEGVPPRAGTDPALARIEDQAASDRRVRWLAGGTLGLLLGAGAGLVLVRRRRNRTAQPAVADA